MFIDRNEANHTGFVNLSYGDGKVILELMESPSSGLGAVIDAPSSSFAPAVASAVGVDPDASAVAAAVGVDPFAPAATAVGVDPFAPAVAAAVGADPDALDEPSGMSSVVASEFVLSSSQATPFHC